MLKNDQEVATETGSQPSPWYLTDDENRPLFYLPAQGLFPTHHASWEADKGSSQKQDHLTPAASASPAL